MRLYQRLFAPNARFLGFLILISLISISVIAFYFYLNLQTQKHRQSLESFVLKQSSTLLQSTSRDIQTSLLVPQQVLLATATIIGTLNTDIWRQEAIVVETVLNHPMFRRLYVADEAGRIIVDSQMSDQRKPHLKDPWLKQVISGQNYISDVHFLQSTPVIDMALPIKTLGRVRSALVAQVDLRAIWNILASLKLGQQGYAFMVSSKGFALFHPKQDYVRYQKSMLADPAVRAVSSGQTGLSIAADQAWIQTYTPIKGSDWGLIFAIHSADVSALTEDLLRAQRFLGYLALVAGALLCVCALGFYRWLQKPRLVLRPSVEAAYKVIRTDHKVRKGHASQKVSPNPKVLRFK